MGRLFLCVVSCLKKKTTSPLSEKSSSTTTNRHTTTMSEEKLGKLRGKLKEITEQSEEIEASREELESKEQEGDERTEELESNLKDMKRTVEMNLLKVVEGDRKNNVCNNEIAKLREKAEKNEAIVTTLEEQIEGFGKRLEELEELKIPTKSLKKNPLKRSHLMKNNFVETSLKMLGELCLIRKVIFNHELGRWNQRLCYRCRKNEKR